MKWFIFSTSMLQIGLTAGKRTRGAKGYVASAIFILAERVTYGACYSFTIEEHQLCCELLKGGISMNTTIQDREAASMAEEGVIPALHAALIRYCLSLTGKRQDAEDLAQEAWLKTLAAPQSESHANPQALLLRVARNSWVDQTRRKAVYAKLIDRERTSAAVSTDPLSPMLEQTFHSLLQRLTPRQLAVFLLRDVFGYCVAEAAQLLQLTEGAIKAAHYRARRTLPAVLLRAR
jgi:RNA polymerase sigma factor (sigma-70 family)